MNNYNEELNRLQYKKKEIEQELDSITVKKYGDIKWDPGVQDQYYSESYSYKEYLNPARAEELKSKLNDINSQIQSCVYRINNEKNREKEERERRTPKYEYTSAGKKETTTSPAMAARYNAQHRFFGMTKTQQTMAKISGQKKKFDELWKKAGNSLSKDEQQKVANELDGLFRR